jgi:hypothetical protein
MARLTIIALSALFVIPVVATAAPQGAPLPVPPAPPAPVGAPLPALGAPVGAPLPAPPPVAQAFAPQELDRIVSPIALYPDPLLGQVLSAATFSPEIPDAARWANQHRYLPPYELPSAIAADQLPWQPSVQALLPFPQVLNMMASAMPWTEEVGAAFLSEPGQVMDAVQRMRRLAYDYGYLRSSGDVVVRRGPFVEITSVNPGLVVVPYYNPAVVFVAPRPGFAIAGAIRFGGVQIGAAFAPWGWGATRFSWGERVLIVNNAPWRRTWANRAVYVHPFAVPRYERRFPEQHERARDERREEGGRRREEGHR